MVFRRLCRIYPKNCVAAAGAADPVAAADDFELGRGATEISENLARVLALPQTLSLFFLNSCVFATIESS